MASNLSFDSLNGDEFHYTFQSSFTHEPSNNDINFQNDAIDEINTQNSPDLELESNDSTPQVPSEYYTTRQFTSVFSPSNSDFSMLHLNIRSANKNFESLRLLLESLSFNCSVIGLSETWFSNHSDPSLFTLPNYNLITNNRQDKAGGGVCLYISNQLEFIHRDELKYMNSNIETIFAEIIIPGAKNIIIGTIYRPPRSNQNDFINCIHEILVNPILNNKHCFLMGDFNINLLNIHSNGAIQSFFDTLSTESFLPLITKPTRIRDTSATLIDNIFTNVLPHPNSAIIISDISDHFPIFSCFHLQRPLPPIHRQTRRFTPDNIASLRSSLRQTDWSRIHNSRDANEAFDIFNDSLTSLLNEKIPLTKIKIKNKKTPKSPWLSTGTLRCINRKNNLYLKYKAKPTEQNKDNYTIYKNTLTTILRREKKNYFSHQFDSIKNDIKRTWQLINCFWNKNDNRKQISRISNQGNIIEDNRKIADLFNDYFINVGPKLAHAIPSSNRSFMDFLDNHISNSIFFDAVLETDVLDLVKNLASKNSAGHDGISNSCLKQIIPDIVKPLTHIFNLSLCSGVVPQKMKLAKVVPIFKKGDALLVNNYRPISLLTSLSKILEKLVYSRTIKFLLDKNVFSDSQFGFREKHSTSHAILNFLDNVARATDNHLHTIGILLDFSKAFDTINHEILLRKLHHYGIRGVALKWFESYLYNRQQFVCINNFNSSTKSLACGVPQGSILGPLLFIIYINDFRNSSKLLSFLLFADDSNIFFSHRNPQYLLHTLNTELHNVAEWIKCNKLSLNLEKTNFMLFSNSLRNLPGNIMLDGSTLNRVQSSRFLGVTIDEDLSWKPHIHNVCNTVSRNIGIINKLKYCFPQHTLKSLYYAIVYPYLNYGILAWGNANKTLMDRLLLLQKKALRIMCNTDYRAHTRDLFFTNRILRINEIFSLQLGVFMFLLNNNELPHIFNSMFTLNQNIHNYPTRQSRSFHLPRTRTLFANHIFTSTGPKLWNSLPIYLTRLKSIHSFKRIFKRNLLSNPLLTISH